MRLVLVDPPTVSTRQVEALENMLLSMRLNPSIANTVGSLFSVRWAALQLSSSPVSEPHMGPLSPVLVSPRWVFYDQI
jgi:hypothetical protein